tara:strand:+ start:8405 stop:8887 length:483 start_codon:yes stop_codon:yes gene_type:complete
MIPKIKMLIVDVDGTLTDGGVYVDENGKETKKFNAKDGIGMMELQKNGVEVGIISNSERGGAILSRAKYLGIKHIYIGDDPKQKILENWITSKNITLADVAFIGDDINDLGIINMVQFSACPKDAVDLIKKKVSIILNTCGGDGCVREFSDLYLRKNKNI